MDLNNLTLKAAPAFDIRRERRQYYRYVKDQRRRGNHWTKAEFRNNRPITIHQWDVLNGYYDCAHYYS